MMRMAVYYTTPPPLLLEEPVGESDMFAQERKTDLRLADEPPRYDECGIRNIPFRNWERNIPDVLPLHQNLERHWAF